MMTFRRKPAAGRRAGHNPGERIMRNLRFVVSLVAAFGCTGALAQGAAFPSKPIVIVVSFPPGANADLEARIYQDGLSTQMKHAVTVDYKPGGSGVIANGYVAKAAPDGHTLALISASTPILSAVRKDMPYNLLKDFAPVVLTTENTTVLLVTPSLPVKNFQEWVAYAKAKPGAVTWSTVGSGRGFHVGGEWLASELGLDLTFVHYKGGSQAEIDLIAGRIHTTPKQLAPSLPLIRSGKARPIAILTKDRSPLLPDMRTVAEMGAPNFAFPSWNGILAPAGTPPAVVTRLHAEMVKGLKTPQAMKRWESEGTLVLGTAPDAFRKRLVSELAQWEKIVKEKNITED
jgi:tripartite-type tricarboxylate transporter receptor subunit TctC